MESLAELLAPSTPDSLFLGVTIAVVTNNRDPDGLGRVKVQLPWIADQVESDWARVVTPMAGPERGLYCLPEVDDEVLVAFEHGRPDRLYVLGGLWNGKDKPPESNSDGKNDRRTIRSRSGHLIRLTDTDGDEKIEIIDKSAKNSIVISTKNNTVTITGEADVSIRSNSGKLKLAGKGVEIDSEAGMDLRARGPLNVKGSVVNIN